jgi:hypothetical protein
MKTRTRIAALVALLVCCAVALLVSPAPGQTGVVVPSRGVYTEPGGDTMQITTDGTVNFQSGATLTNSIGAGTIVSTNSISLVEYGDGVLHKTTFTLANAFDMLVVDSGANGGHAGVKIYDFPAGYILVEAAFINADYTATNTNGLTATATYDIGVGSADVGVDNAALATTEQNFITKIEGDLSASAAQLHSVNVTSFSLDGTSTAADLYVNAAFAADDCSADQAGVLAGTITVYWVNLGDY